MSSGGNQTASEVGVISDQTCAPWRLLLVPFLAFGYILVRACLQLVTCDVRAVLRDLRELFKALAWVGSFMGSTMLILFLISIKTAKPDGSMHKTKLEEIHDLEFGFIAAISLITVFTTVRSWQTRHGDKEMLSQNGCTPANVFMDLGDRSMVTAITCFFGQNILFIYLMGGIWSGFDAFRNTPSMEMVQVLAAYQFPSFRLMLDSFIFLVTAAMVQNLIWGQMGASFEDNIPYWKTMWKEFRGLRVEIFDTEAEHGKKNKGWWILRCLDEADDEEPQPQEQAAEKDRALVYEEPEMGDWIYLRSEVAWHELIVRGLMSWWVNGVMRKLVVMLVPLMLITVDSYLDFVQNATALTFIVQLDDLASGRRFRIHKHRAGSADTTPSMKTALLS
jgi:hypothetical protein